MLFGKHINKYYLKYWIFFLLGFICLVAVDWFQLQLPIYLGEIVDLISKNQITNDVLISYLVKIIIIAAILFVGRMGWRFTLFYASKKIEADIRREMFQKAEELSTEYYHTTKIGTIMSWLTSDLETLEEYLGWGTLMMVDGIFLTIFSLVKMFMLDWAISIIVLIPITLIAIWGALMEKTMNRKWTLRQEEYDRMYDYSQENFSGIRVIKAFVKESQQIKKFATIAKLNKDMNVEFAKAAIIFDTLLEIIIHTIFYFILAFGGYLTYCCVTGINFSIFGEQINRTAGYLIEYVGFFDTLIWPMIALGQVITMFSKARASFKRISSFLDQNVNIKSLDNPIIIKELKGSISFNNFNFSYKNNELLALKNINLNIKPGELIGVVGRVGSGKTTLAMSLLHLYNVNKNQIFIDDNDLMDYDIKSLRDNIAYVPQDNFLFSDTIKDNITFGINGDISDKKVLESGVFSNIDTDVRTFENGYETMLGERGQTLSGGQRQRIAISRAYIKNSPIMILDDSVSAVDLKTEEIILDNIKKYRKGKTTIIVASRISTIKNADKVIVLNNGEVEAFDTPNNLLKISPTFIKLNKLQELEEEVINYA